MRVSILMLLFFMNVSIGWAQCDGTYPQNQSPKIANYDIKVDLDHRLKLAKCTQSMEWRNTSPDTLYELRLYMYMNAFKDMNSTYLKGGDTDVFGQNLLTRKAEEWGYITIHQFLNERGDVLDQQYIQPDDQNPDDQSVVAVRLKNPILPGKTRTFSLQFDVKLPRTIVRSGYGKNDFFLFVHWFPQMGVYEQNQVGFWEWNCHQFMRGTEFYADFGDYEVEINAPDHLVIGGSGCRISETKENGRKTVRFQAFDIIDFGWVAYPTFDVYTSDFMGVDIEILMPPEHCAFADRYLTAIQHALEYLGEHVGKYPYPKITVVDPPVHTLNAGFMEYPMMITGASFYGIPKNVRTVESLVIHEFTHMYFMATLASNEKEEAWLDEGFVTYFEDRIMDHYYGGKSSLFDVFGFKSGNAENSRLEYTSLPLTSVGPVARPGWEIKFAYKGLVYAKMATILKTLEGIVSKPVMDEIVQTYFQSFKFKHPREADFRKVVSEVLSTHSLSVPFDEVLYFDQCLHGTDICDFELTKSSDRSIVVRQKGTLIVPCEIEIGFSDGTIVHDVWDGKGKEHRFEFENGKDIKYAIIDPNKKVYLDIDFTNNSFTNDINHKPLVFYAGKSQSWMQSVLQWITYLW